jgi:hypothetical protein
MTLRIKRARARIRLSGEFRSEHLDQVKAEIELCESPQVLDLEELDLIDVESVRFLNACEAKLHNDRDADTSSSPSRGLLLRKSKEC